MRPLTIVAVGLVLVAIDVRTEHLDFFPDALGWALVAVGAWRLSLTAPAMGAAVAALLTLPEVSLPAHFVMLDPATGETITPPRPGIDLAYPEQLVFDDLTGWRLVAAAAAAVAAGVTLWLLLGALATRASAWERRDTARQIRWLRWLVVGVWVAPYLGVLTVSALGEDRSFDPVWNGGMEYLALAGVVAIGLLVWLLIREANRAWAVPGSSDRWSAWLRPQPPRRADGQRPA